MHPFKANIAHHNPKNRVSNGSLMQMYTDEPNHYEQSEVK